MLPQLAGLVEYKKETVEFEEPMECAHCYGYPKCGVHIFRPIAHGVILEVRLSAMDELKVTPIPIGLRRVTSRFLDALCLYACKGILYDWTFVTMFPSVWWTVD